MVEGPTAKAYALRIGNEFQNEIVRDVFARSKRIFVSIEELISKKFLSSNSLGKNIILFLNGLAIRIHLMMFGSIHIYRVNYRVNGPLLKPMRRVKLQIKSEKKKLVVYNAPIVEIDRSERILERLKRNLGPDPLSDDWNREKAIRNIMKFPGEKTVGNSQN